MSNELYSDLQGIATDLIEEFGRKVEIILHHCPPINPVTGAPSGVETIELISGVVSSQSAKLMSDVRMVGNSSIMTSDRQVLIPGTVAIVDSDKLEFDGYTWGILKRSPVNPGGLVIYTDIWVRR